MSKLSHRDAEILRGILNRAKQSPPKSNLERRELAAQIETLVPDASKIGEMIIKYSGPAGVIVAIITLFLTLYLSADQQEHQLEMERIAQKLLEAAERDADTSARILEVLEGQTASDISHQKQLLELIVKNQQHRSIESGEDASYHKMKHRKRRSRREQDRKCERSD